MEKSKRDHDLKFTIQDMIKIYYGESDYAKYDRSACQWNQFLKDFCTDECSQQYTNKLTVALSFGRKFEIQRTKKFIPNSF